MDGPVLCPPRNAVSLLHRPELEQRLIASVAGQVVLIEAPAGYGKTEAMAGLYRSAPRRGVDALWIALSPGMQPADLSRMIANALDLHETDPARHIGALHQRDRPVEVFLDDADRASHADLLAWLVENPPDQLRLVIAGRSLPDLHLSRLRVRGLLTELDASHLTFSPSETRRLLRHWMTAEQIERIIATLNGWPALVRLAVMECERGAKGLTLNALIEGNARVYRDFLHEEVFSGLDETEWKVLRAVAGLDSFTPNIAAELAGLPRDYPTLRRIETMYPLVLPEPQNPGWFALSPVICRALEIVTEAEPAEARRARHIRAAELYENCGILEKSVLHASLAGDVGLAVRTIERAGGVNLFLRAGYTVLRGIVKAVPHETVLATPSLRLCRAVMLAKSGRIREARSVIDLLLQDTRAGRIDDDPSWVAMLDHIHRLHEIYEDKPMDAETVARRRAEAESERPDNTWRLAWLYNNLAIYYTRLGDLKEANACAERALSLYQEERSSYPQIFMLIHLGFIAYRANRLEAALEHLAEAVRLINARHWNDANLLAICHVPLFAIRYLQGQVEQTRDHLERDMRIMAHGEGWVDFFVQGYAALARARFAQDGWVAAQDVLQDGLALADARGLPRLRLSMSILRAELLTRAQQLEAAETTVRQWPDPTRAGDWPTPRERREAQLAIARLRLREGRTDEAHGILTRLADEARAAQRWGLLIRVSLLLAEAWARRGEATLALEALEEAAILSRPGGQVQQYRDEGPEFAEVMRKLVRRSGLSRLKPVTVKYVAAVTANKTRRSRGGALLSRRETEILTLLADGLSNKAIARKLDITEPTVKFHLKNLYSKLGVGRRSLAVSVARASGLVE